MKKLWQIIKRALRVVGRARQLRFAYVALATLILTCLGNIESACAIAFPTTLALEILSYIDIEKKDAKAFRRCYFNFAADFLGMVLAAIIVCFI